ncbi:MAG: class I SAM-dependent methyltransferase [Actinomycetota bacterium]
MRSEQGPETSLRSHWEAIFASRDPKQVSWYQREAGDSLELIEKLGVAPEAPVIDVGGGESRLVDGLLPRGFSDVSVLDISERALSMARERLGPEQAVTWLHEDLLQWRPPRTYALWHDRAVFHFFTKEDHRQRYLEVLKRATAPGGHVIIATFAPEGPDHCSNLPVSRYNPQDLAQMLGADYDPLIMQHREHVTPGGAVQPFSWLAARRRG